MDPWDIIGWAVIVLVVVLVGTPLLRWGIAWLLCRILHYLTRNEPPAVGQVWMQGDTRLYIKEMYDNGDFVVSTARRWHKGTHSSWRETPAEWKFRTEACKLWLNRTESEAS